MKMPESMNSEASNPLQKQPRHQRWLKLTLVSWMTLIALLLVWHQRVPTPHPTSSLLLALLPLLIPAIALLKGKRGAVLTVAVIALLYFSHAVVGVTAGGIERIWAIAELLVSTCLFLSATFTAKYLPR